MPIITFGASLIILSLAVALFFGRTAAIVTAAIGIVFVILGVIRQKKLVAKAEAEHIAQIRDRQQVLGEQTHLENPPGMPSKPYVKCATVKVNGVTFPCEKDPNKQRQDVISRMREQDIVTFEPFVLDGKPTHLVIDKRSGLDIGILPYFVAEEYPDSEVEGFVIEANSFIPKDSEDQKEIWYCKVKFYVSKEQ